MDVEMMSGDEPAHTTLLPDKHVTHNPVVQWVLWNGIRQAGIANYLYLYVRSPIPSIS